MVERKKLPSNTRLIEMSTIDGVVDFKRYKKLRMLRALASKIDPNDEPIPLPKFISVLADGLKSDVDHT